MKKHLFFLLCFLTSCSTKLQLMKNQLDRIESLQKVTIRGISKLDSTYNIQHLKIYEFQKNQSDNLLRLRGDSLTNAIRSAIKD